MCTHNLIPYTCRIYFILDYFHLRMVPWLSGFPLLLGFHGFGPLYLRRAQGCGAQGSQGQELQSLVVTPPVEI